jgi:hypothetical protein
VLESLNTPTNTSTVRRIDTILQRPIPIKKKGSVAWVFSGFVTLDGPDRAISCDPVAALVRKAAQQHAAAAQHRSSATKVCAGVQSCGVAPWRHAAAPPRGAAPRRDRRRSRDQGRLRSCPPPSPLPPAMHRHVLPQRRGVGVLRQHMLLHRLGEGVKVGEGGAVPGRSTLSQHRGKVPRHDRRRSHD